MAPVVPTIEPTDVTAGSTWTWKMSSGIYPISEGWTLSYAIRGLAALAWSTSWISNDGSSFTIVIPPASTLPLKEGSYEFTRIWAGSGSYAGQTFYEQLPTLTVQADPVTAIAGARVPMVEQAYTAVKAAYYARLAGDEPEEYTIGGRSVRKMSISDLWKQLCILASRVTRLRNGGELPGYQVRFTTPTP